MLILGLNAWHPDAAACLLDDGHIVAAAEEERFVREKHRTGFPREAVRFCMAFAGARAHDLDAVAVNSDPRASRVARALFALTSACSPSLIAERLRTRRRRADARAEVARCLDAAPLRAPLVAVEHHRAHMASAFYCSPFAEAAVVSVDGFGDFASAAWGEGAGDALELRERVLFPHSLGIFYQAVTQFLGFPAYGDEYKVMGLAPYGEPRFATAMQRLLRLEPAGHFTLDLRCFRHHRLALGLDAGGGAPRFPPLYSPDMTLLLGPPRATDDAIDDRHRDIARSAQQRYEEALMHLLRHVREATGQRALALAGGCAMNSVANGKVYAGTGFERLFVQPGAGDAGGALGAALCAHRDARGSLPRAPMRHAALGPEFDDGAIAAILDARGQALARAGCVRGRAGGEEALCRDTAAAIARGEVVGWFQGRMEWGPRALGQRSILADPRRADMRNLLNDKIKRRESFRPFAPSVLREAVAQWFEVDDDVPFMMKVYPLRRERRAQVPAVTHVDGTGRLQTVTARDNPLYHRLIRAFALDTGVPMVLNTSFNESEPIVCRPEEAIDCFLRTRMDRLVLGLHVLTRAGGPG